MQQDVCGIPLEESCDSVGMDSTMCWREVGSCCHIGLHQLQGIKKAHIHFEAMLRHTLYDDTTVIGKVTYDSSTSTTQTTTPLSMKWTTSCTNTSTFRITR